jgi:hypothetical protein
LDSIRLGKYGDGDLKTAEGFHLQKGDENEFKKWKDSRQWLTFLVLEESIFF